MVRKQINIRLVPEEVKQEIIDQYLRKQECEKFWDDYGPIAKIAVDMGKTKEQAFYMVYGMYQGLNSMNMLLEVTENLVERLKRIREGEICQKE